MDQEPKNLDTVHRHRLLWPLLLFVVTLVVFAHEYETLFYRISQADETLAKAIKGVSFSYLTDDFMERFEGCKYHYLFICEGFPNLRCEIISRDDIRCFPDDNPQLKYDIFPRWLPGIFSIMVGVVTILPRLPDAIWYALKKRFFAGNYLQFFLMVIFIGVNLFIMGAFARDIFSSRENPLSSIFRFLMSIILTPIAFFLLLWLLQYLFLGLTYIFGIFIQSLLLAAALPAALFVWLKPAHDLNSLAQEMRNIMGHILDLIRAKKE